jgi:hypothetical protein
MGNNKAMQLSSSTSISLDDQQSRPGVSSWPDALPTTTTVAAKFLCHVCGRTYKKKDSLTRHSHNHQDSQRHICVQCGQNFRRRDTLQRHLDLHYKGRKRGSHACKRCRVIKVRCNSQTPCSTCAQAHQECTYGPTATPHHGLRSLAALLNQQQPSADENQHVSRSPQEFRSATPVLDQHSILNSFSVSNQVPFDAASVAECEPSQEEGSASSSMPRHGFGTDAIDMAMTNARSPLPWDHAVSLPWMPTDLFLHDDFNTNTARLASDPMLISNNKNDIFDLDDNLGAISQASSGLYSGLSFDGLTADGSHPLIPTMESPEYYMNSKACMFIVRHKIQDLGLRTNRTAELSNHIPIIGAKPQRGF